MAFYKSQAGPCQLHAASLACHQDRSKADINIRFRFQGLGPLLDPGIGLLIEDRLVNIKLHLVKLPQPTGQTLVNPKQVNGPFHFDRFAVATIGHILNRGKECGVEIVVGDGAHVKSCGAIGQVVAVSHLVEVFIILQALQRFQDNRPDLLSLLVRSLFRNREGDRTEMDFGRQAIIIQVGAIVFDNFPFGHVDLTAHLFTDQLVTLDLLAQVVTLGLEIHPLHGHGILEVLPGQLVLLLHIEQSGFYLILRDTQPERLDPLLNQGLLDHA